MLSRGLLARIAGQLYWRCRAVGLALVVCRVCEVAVVECEPQQLRVAGGGGGRGRARGVSGAGQQEVAVSGGGVEVPRPLSFYLQAGRRRGGVGALEQFQLGWSTGLY